MGLESEGGQRRSGSISEEASISELVDGWSYSVEDGKFGKGFGERRGAEGSILPEHDYEPNNPPHEAR